MVEQFGTELGRPDNSDVSYLPFDSKSGNFILAESRQHFEFETSLTEHKMKMKQVEKDILTAEKRLTGLETESNQQENDEDVSHTPADEETSKKKNKRM